jgi:hypothetical protein
MMKVPELGVRNLTIPAVRRGTRVSVISPASYPQPERLAQGSRRWAVLASYLPWAGKRSAKAHHYFAGTAQARLDDLHAAFLDPQAPRYFVAVEVTVRTICLGASTWAWCGSIPSR